MGVQSAGKVSVSSESSSDYFQSGTSGLNSGAATPRATTEVVTPSDSTHNTSRRIGEGEHHKYSSQPEEGPTNTNAHPAQRQPQPETKDGERSFGTNLTTGQPEYLSQYDHLRDEKPSPGTPIERWEDHGDSMGTGTSSEKTWGYTSDVSSGTESSDNDIY